MDAIITIILIVLIVFAISFAKAQYFSPTKYVSSGKIKLKNLNALIKVIENGSVGSKVDISIGLRGVFLIEKQQNNKVWWIENTILKKESEKFERILEKYKTIDIRTKENTTILANEAYSYNLGTNIDIVTDIIICYFTTIEEYSLNENINYLFKNTYTKDTLRGYLKELNG